VETLYLILHKVRGEATFDVAQRLQIGSEQGWIIPTSGHRAYPWRHWLLEDLADISDITSCGTHDQPWTHDGDLPHDWPDHYGASPTPITSRARPNAVADVSALFGGGPSE
jgi:hypothetical protein